MTPWRALGLSAVSALLLLGSFDPVAADWLVWVALVPFLVALHGASLKRALACGTVAGFLFHFVQHYWVVVAVWENRDWLPYNHLVSAFVSFGAWVGAAWVVTPSVLLFAALVAASSRRLPGLGGFWLVAPAWCACEFLRSLGALGHVWGNLGYCLWRRAALIQSADVGGVYLTAFLVALVNSAVAAAIVARGDARGLAPVAGRRRTARRLALVAGGVFSLNLLYGWAQLRARRSEPGEGIRTAVVQESIPVQEKTVSTSVPEALRRHAKATLSAKGSQLVVWPETSLPTVVSGDPRLMLQLFELTAEANAVLVVGAMDRNERDEYFNGALILEPGRGVVGRSYKRHLVPFGERVPYQPWLPFLRAFQARDPEFTPGPDLNSIETRVGRLGVCVCFESMFPSVCRQLAANGAELLVVITNDDWFRETFAPAEHAAMSAFRAVETRRDVVRAANTGISCFFDETGRRLRYTEMMERTVIVQRVHARQEKSLYVRFGDWFALLCAALVAMALLFPRANARDTEVSADPDPPPQ